MTRPDEEIIGKLNELIAKYVSQYLPREIYTGVRSQNEDGGPMDLGKTLLWWYSCLKEDDEFDSLCIGLDTDTNAFEITGVSNNIRTPEELVKGIEKFFLQKSGKDTEPSQ